VIRKPKAAKRALVIAVLLVVVACGSAAATAAIPVFWVSLHARLAPIAGTTFAGRFNGTLLVTAGPNRLEPSDSLPQKPGQSTLNWKLSLSALRGPISAWLRLHATKSAAPVARVLCERCSTQASGSLKLTAAQGLRIVRSRAVVVVRTPTATLRGPVKVTSQIVPLPAG
jgi:hypothetical protein